MHVRSAVKTGSPGTIFASFLHFDLCFTIWVLLGALGVYIASELKLSPIQQGLMVAIPTLSGSLMRILIGLLSDRIGGKIVGTAMLIFLCLPLLLGWLLPVNFPLIIIIGLMLGVAGASFAVALPLASRWYPPSQQGLVMGITAAGNIGTVIANLFAPRLAKAYGWHSVMGFTLIPLLAVLVIFILLAKDSPNRPKGEPASKYLVALKRADLWWFCLFYSVTFGGFVGLGTFLPLFFHNQYGLSPINAGLLTAIAAFMGSTLRPVGGYLSDRFGGVVMLTILFTLIGILYALAAFLFPLVPMTILLIVSVSCLGMGNGAVFQLVPQRFRDEIGIATGVVGACGGIGGFLLPTLLGSVKQLSGSYAAGMIVLALCALCALVVLRLLILVRKGWHVETIEAVKGELA